MAGAIPHHVPHDERFRSVPYCGTAEWNGFYPVEGNRWKRGDELYLPLYQGRMIHQFDHRANSVRVNPENMHNPYLSEEVSDEQHADSGFLPDVSILGLGQNVEEDIPRTRGYSLGFRDIANPTDVRTAIASIVPWAGFGNKVPLLLPVDGGFDARGAACSIGESQQLRVRLRHSAKNPRHQSQLVHRRAVAGHRQDGYGQRFGKKTAGELVRDHVLRLTFTSDDMSPFARDLGYTGYAVRVGRRRAAAPSRPARRAVLPPVRPVERRCGLHPRHLPDSPAARRERVRQLPHQRTSSSPT